jgi:hypothetical protein
VGLKVLEDDHAKKIYDFDTFLGANADSKIPVKLPSSV